MSSGAKMKEKEKKKTRYRLKKGQKIFLLLTLISLAAALTLHFIFLSFPKELQAQYAWERFRGDNKSEFSQVSVFLPHDKDKAFTVDRLFELRSSYKGAFAAAGKAAEGETVWDDAFSSKLKVSIKSEKGETEAKAFAVGGDYFLFHPLMLKSGSYIAESDFMHDGIVVDEVTSWKLFGGIDTAGKTVYIAGKPYIVKGVVSLEKDKLSQSAIVEEGIIFMHFDAAESRGEERLPIEYYEFVGKEPISNFCQSLMKEKFENAEIKKIDGRFSESSIYSLLFGYLERGTKAILLDYPYWENAAVMSENRLALILLLKTFFLILPVALAAYAAYKTLAYLRRKIFAEFFPKLKNNISETIRKRQRSRILKKQENESKKDE